MANQTKIVILDSSVWIGYFHKHDLHHKKSLEIINRYKDFKFFVPEIVYFETLTKIFKLSNSVDLLLGVRSQLNSNKDIIVVKINRKKLETLFLKYIQKVSLKSSDFQILLYTLNYPIVSFETFDKKLLAAYCNLKNNDL